MERHEVVETLQSLANGAAVDDARILEALEMAVRLLGKRGAGGDLPPATGARWTADEEQRLLRAFDEGATIASLAAAHGRKSGGIRARLVKLGRLETGTPGAGAGGARAGGAGVGGASAGGAGARGARMASAASTSAGGARAEGAERVPGASVGAAEGGPSAAAS